MIQQRTRLTETQTEGLRKCRQRAGLSQKQIANLLDFSQRTISNWENGECESVPRIAIRSLLGIYWFQSDGDVMPLYRKHNLMELFDHTGFE